MSNSECLLACRRKSEEQMTAFIEEPLNTNDAGFWDPISKRKIKTYCSMTKKAKVKDRYSQCRLGLIVASTCQINPMEVMTYEFSPILCALAHQDGTLNCRMLSKIS